MFNLSRYNQTFPLIVSHCFLLKRKGLKYDSCYYCQQIPKTTISLSNPVLLLPNLDVFYVSELHCYPKVKNTSMSSIIALADMLLRYDDKQKAAVYSESHFLSPAAANIHWSIFSHRWNQKSSRRLHYFLLFEKRLLKTSVWTFFQTLPTLCILEQFSVGTNSLELWTNTSLVPVFFVGFAEQ